MVSYKNQNKNEQNQKQGGGEVFVRTSKRRRHLPKIRTFKKIGNFLWTDRQTDRQTDIVVHREVSKIVTQFMLFCKTNFM